ncbi:MAG: hypothetical protein OEW08_06680 [Gammaproteobacteria bacterium]|nr:hypothetical protein [Gammaproteobacteria bacterium]
MKIHYLLLFPLTLGLSSCLIESNQPKPSSGENPLGLVTSGPARYLSKQTYDSLTPVQQFQVANKLLGTLYKGISARDFFDMSAGFSNPRAKGVDVIGDAQRALKEPMDRTEFSQRNTELQHKYLSTYNSATKTYAPREVRETAYAAPLAIMHGLPLSKEHFAYWVAYLLTNNILFSPAGEMDSVFSEDVERIYNTLADAILHDRPIGDIVYDHMISQSNWRRFRSPEDNVREMMEIYLLRFRDDEVPRAAQACKNWFLTSDDEGYQLRITSDVNDVPVPDVLDTNSIVTCYDFYRRIATHPALIPTMVARAVDLMFPNYPTDQRAALVNSITQSHPTRFDQIFASVVFSEEYLLHNARMKIYEENHMNYLARMKHEPLPANDKTTDYFVNLTGERTNNDAPTLRMMNQGALYYKLGRLFGTPTDTLSVSYAHKALREQFRNYRGDVATNANAKLSWFESLINNPEAIQLNDDDFLRYVFINVTGRMPSTTEFDKLKALFGPTAKGGQGWLPLPTYKPLPNIDRISAMQNVARSVFDYTSRLVEIYAYN